MDDNEFHTYEIEWTPHYLSFSVDGEEIRRKEGVSSLTKDLFLFMSIAKYDQGHSEEDVPNLPYFT